MHPRRHLRWCQWTALSLFVACGQPDDSPSPSSPGPTPTATTPGGTASATPTGARTPTATASGTPTATLSGTPTATASGTPTATLSGTPTATLSGTPTATASGTPTATASGTPTATPGSTPTATATPTLGETPTQPITTPTLDPDADDDGYAPEDGDCDDTDATVYPGAVEITDGKDNNCDTLVDNTPDTVDNDGDTYSESEGDCDDTESDVYPGAEETPYDGVDQDCDGADLIDVDDDGAPGVDEDPDLVDCDDDDPEVYPGAAEICDGVDQDCDDLIDDGVGPLFYRDADDDGFGAAGSTVRACAAPEGYVANTQDCDDTNGSIYPDAVESCDGVDQDCDLQADEGTQTVYYADDDNDTYGDPTDQRFACDPVSGYVLDRSDCNDAKAGVNPSAPETCDGEDDDCDSGIDEDVLTTFYLDSDNDGFGGQAATTEACVKPAGYSTNRNDCDDRSNTVNPNATEVCDGVDNDCDTQTDEGVRILYFRDVDGDGHGVPSVTNLACSVPSGFAESDDDCDDNDAAVYPTAPEICDAQDNDCDDLADDADPVNTGALVVFFDLDGDGFGDPAASDTVCSVTSGPYVLNAGDCDDDDEAVRPNAEEICDDLDNNCNDAVDSADPGLNDGTFFYRDADGDTFGGSLSPQPYCERPAGYVSNDDDCNDASAVSYPGAAEICDGLDNDCDTTSDDGAAASCPGEDTECSTRVCEMGSCDVRLGPVGDPLPTQSVGDCHTRVCGPAGEVLDQIDDDDVPDDGKDCTLGSCAAGVPSTSNAAEGSTCDDAEGTRCDGTGKCRLTYVVAVVGSGSGSLTSAATQVSLRERFQPTNVDVGGGPFPLTLRTGVSGVQQPFTVSGTATSEGQLSLSVDGRYLVIAGYAATPGTSPVSSATASAVPRVVATVSASGEVDTSTLLGTAFNGGSVRGVTSLDGTKIWAAGTSSPSGTGGAWFTQRGQTTATQVLAAPNNARFLHIFGERLMGSSGSSPFTNIFYIGGGMPENTGITATSLAGMPTTSGPSPYDFVLFDLNPAVAGDDTMYVADDRSLASGGGVQKWTFDGATWTLEKTHTNMMTNGARHITGRIVDGFPLLLVTTAESGLNRVLSIHDQGATVMTDVEYTAPANTVLRGIAFPPR